jgi:hypothetical protein
MSRYSGAGLCASCENARLIVSRTGSKFHLCELSRGDPGFPRYPRLPTLRCTGYAPATLPPGAAEQAPTEASSKDS